MALEIINNTKQNLKWMVERPIAHRGLHDADKGIYENTLSAAQAAVDANYSIELDLQPSLDKVPMVFHDYNLTRLTDHEGKTRAHDRDSLSAIAIKDTNDTIPTLKQFLDLVDGKVGIVVELKGQKDTDEGFVRAVAAALENYTGPVAIMSFHHHILVDARKYAPHLALGLTAEGEDSHYYIHKRIAESAHVDFISYNVKELDSRFVAEFRETGRPIISWTVRSEEDKKYSDKFADQITFEGFKP